jgi:hypothetical protein
MLSILGSIKVLLGKDFVSRIILFYVASSRIPHKLQPCDVSVFTRLKDKYRDEAEHLF